VQGGDVYPGDPLHCVEQFLAGPARSLALPDDLAQLQRRLFAVADEEGIHEVCQGLGREGHRATGHDEGMPLVPIG